MFCPSGLLFNSESPLENHHFFLTQRHGESPPCLMRKNIELHGPYVPVASSGIPNLWLTFSEQMWITNSIDGTSSQAVKKIQVPSSKLT